MCTYPTDPTPHLLTAQQRTGGRKRSSQQTRLEISCVSAHQSPEFTIKLLFSNQTKGVGDLEQGREIHM